MTCGTFYGCYLLHCTTEKFIGDTYIGFTVDPERRIRQHNSGVKSGGAFATSKKGSWDMTLIVHGFPNEKSALRFEWAWQHPTKSRRLQHLPKRRRGETKYDFALRIMSCMLNTGPWMRLSLTVQWLMTKYKRPLSTKPPPHMPIVDGSINQLEKIVLKPLNTDDICSICKKLPIAGEKWGRCDRCDVTHHVTCLAMRSLAIEEGALIPIVTKCPVCRVESRWGDWLRRNVITEDAVVYNASEEEIRNTQMEYG